MARGARRHDRRVAGDRLAYPVADTPAWVTLEVAHGGFATGRYLTDAGLAALRTALATEAYRVAVPEDAVLPVVAWLLGHGHAEAALDLVTELRPLLRLAPLPGAAGGRRSSS